MAAARGEADPVEQGVDALGRAGPAEQFQRQADVLLGAEVRHEVKLLEDDADVAGPEAGQLGLGHPHQVPAGHQDAAAVRPVEPGEQGHQGGFAAARLAGDGQGLPGRKRQGGPAQHHQRFAVGLGIAFAQVLHLKEYTLFPARRRAHGCTGAAARSWSRRKG